MAIKPIVCEDVIYIQLPQHMVKYRAVSKTRLTKGSMKGREFYI